MDSPAFKAGMRCLRLDFRIADGVLFGDFRQVTHLDTAIGIQLKKAQRPPHQGGRCAFRSKEVRNQSELPRCINRQQSQHMLLKISVYDSRYNSAHALDETQPQQLPCLGALMQSCCSSMKLPMVV